MNKICYLISVALVLLMPGYAVASCDDAERNYSLAQRAMVAGDRDKAFKNFRQATVVCGDRYEYWFALGAVAADLNKNTVAADAYVQATETASTPDEFVRAAGENAKLHYQIGDPNRAREVIQRARAANPDLPRNLKELESEIDQRLAKNLVNDLRAGLNLPQLALVTASWAPPEQEQPALAVATSSRKPIPSARVAVQINFEVGSTRVDASSEGEIDKLAMVLAEKPGNYLFTGHADVRGGAAYNKALSLTRAQAIRDMVVSMQPQLRGSIQVDGKGEEQPLTRGNTEADHQKNRRLEVRVTN